MNELVFVSHLFLRSNNALSRGCNKDKNREASALLVTGLSEFVLYTSDSFIYFCFSSPSWTSTVSVTVIFTVQWHSFSLSLLCHEADVTDQSARQLCLMSKAPRYKGKLWCLAGFMEILFHPSCCLLPHSLLLYVTRFFHHGNSLRDYTHTKQLKSW